MISPKRLRQFGVKHKDAKPSMDNWLMITHRATWRSFSDLKTSFNTADVVGRRTVFNIGGNKYRLIARVNYEAQKVYILHVLTHAEYDKGDWKK